MKSGACNVRTLYSYSQELARYKLHFAGVQEVRWDNGGIVKAADYSFFYGKGNENH
jgi:hypothetical protein